MKRKRGSKSKRAVQAVPDDILAEGSGPVRRADVDAIATVEDVVTTDDIATTEDVVTPDHVVGTAMDPAPSKIDGSPDDTRDAGSDHELAGDDGEPGDAGDGGDADGGASASALDDASNGVHASDADDSELGAAGANGEGEEHDAHGEANGEAHGESNGETDGDDDANVVFPTSAATMDATQIKHLVEALIFASDRPLTVQRLRQLTRVSDVKRLAHALDELAQDYRERGIVLQQVSGGYQFRTRTQFSAWVQQLIAGRPVRLSRAQLETLAIIAYRQPITRPEIDDIRGVDSSNTLKLLLDRMLIRTLGKREEVGRPTLYGTTKEFLDFFSLGDLRELPTLREYSELTAESRKVMSDRLGISPDEVAPASSSGSDDDGSGGDGGAGGEGGGGDSGDGGGGGPAGSGGLPGDGFGGGAPDDGISGDAPASASADDLADALSDVLAGDGVAASASADELIEDLADDLADSFAAPIADEVSAESASEVSADEVPADDASAGEVLATFLSAADAVERSNAAAVGELDDEHDPAAE